PAVLRIVLWCGAVLRRIPDAGKLRLPAAYVVPSDDAPGETKITDRLLAGLTEGFSVIVVLSNERDEKGSGQPMTPFHDVRRELWKALLG
uniref:phage tail terminator protein n=1 Tax=Escherichia coli TaxID=562 RepID=UPI003B27BD77